MDNEQATFWLSQFIGKNLRVHASDGRVFGGQMKCTDKVRDGLALSLIEPLGGVRVDFGRTDNVQDRNIILALAHEYRAPSAEAIRKAVEESGNPSISVQWNSRYVGLIVIPGQHIRKIEFEESSIPSQRGQVTL